MGGSDYTSNFASNSRIADGAGSYQGICDASIINWETSNKFVLSIWVLSTKHGGATETLKLQWRDNHDAPPAWADLGATGELKQGSATDPGDAGCQTEENSYFIQNGNSVEVVTTGETYDELRIVVDPAGAEAGHEYEFILYSITQSTQLDTAAAATISITGGLPAVPSHSAFKTPQYSGTAHHVALGFTWNSGNFNYGSGMCSFTGSGTSWSWYVVSSSSTHWYPSGNPLSWRWISGSAYS